MRRIKSIENSNKLNDHNILIIDEENNVFEIYNTMFYSHYYYDVEPFLNKFKENFIGKSIKFKRKMNYQKDKDEKTTVDDIFITTDEDNNDVFAVLNNFGDIIKLPAYFDIEKIEQMFNEIDPYGEDDWDEN